MTISRRDLTRGAASLLAISAVTGPSAAAPGWRSVAPIPEGENEMVGAAVGGKLYVYGGLKSSEFRSLGLLYSYDPVTNAWAKLSGNAVPLHHAAPAAVGGKIYLFGGFDFTRPKDQPVGWLPVPSASVYDPATGRWESLPDMPTARGAAAAVAVGDKIHVISGAAEPNTRGDKKGLSITGPVEQSTAHEVFDTATRSWSKRTPILTGRNHHGAAEIDGKIHVVGGRVGFFGGTFTNLGTHEVYDIALDTWTTRPLLPTPRSGIGVVALKGKIHVIGGEGFITEFGGTFRTHEIFDPATLAWNTGPRMPTPRHGFGCAVLNDEIYAVSGTNVAGGAGPYTPLTVAEVYSTS